MTRNEIEQLEDIFYSEQLYDFVLAISHRKPRHVLGACDLSDKTVYLYKPLNYYDALFTLLHEIAHARIQSGHTKAWEDEFIRLLNKYDFPRDTKFQSTHLIGPNVMEYLNG